MKSFFTMFWAYTSKPAAKKRRDKIFCAMSIRFTSSKGNFFSARPRRCAGNDLMYALENALKSP